MLQGLIWCRRLVVVGFVLMVVGIGAGLYGPRVKATTFDWPLPSVLVDESRRGDIGVAADAHLIWGRGLKKKSDQAEGFETAALELEELTPRKELAWGLGREHELAVARDEVERKERERNDDWLRIGATLFGIGVLCTFLGLGLGLEETWRRARTIVLPDSSVTDGDVARTLSTPSGVADSVAARVPSTPGEDAPSLPASSAGLDTVRPAVVVSSEDEVDEVAEPLVPTSVALEPIEHIRPMSVPDSDGEDRKIFDAATDGGDPVEPVVVDPDPVEPVVEPDVSRPIRWRVVAERFPEGVNGAGIERVTAEGDDTMSVTATISPRIDVVVTPYPPEPGVESGGETPTAA